MIEIPPTVEQFLARADLMRGVWLHLMVDIGVPHPTLEHECSLAEDVSAP